MATGVHMAVAEGQRVVAIRVFDLTLRKRLDLLAPPPAPCRSVWYHLAAPPHPATS